jgi:hypothetical protein
MMEIVRDWTRVSRLSPMVSMVLTYYNVLYVRRTVNRDRTVL